MAFALLVVTLFVACGGGGGGGDGDNGDDGGQQTASYGDRTASALGDATLTTQDGSLVVSNLGSGGNGVSIPAHSSGSDALRFNQLDLSTQGATVSFAITETSDDPSQAEVQAEVTFENTGDRIEYSVTEWDGSDWSASVLSDSGVAGSASGSGTPIEGSVPSGTQLTGAAATSTESADGFSFEFANAAQITLPDGSSAQGSELTINRVQNGAQTSQLDPAPWAWQVIGGGLGGGNGGGGNGGGPGPIIIDFPPIPIPLGSCDLEISKTSSGDFSPGGTGTIEITVTNTGWWNCWRAIEISDALPPHVDYVSGSASSGWSCSTSNNSGTGPDSVVCQGTGPKQNGDSVTLSFDVEVGEFAGCQLGNTASVEMYDLPPNPSPGLQRRLDDDDSNNTTHALIDTGAGECVQPPGGMSAWWRANQSPDDATTNNNHGTLIDDTSYSSGYVEHSFRFDNEDDDGDGERDYVRVADDSALNFGTGSFTLDTWVHLAEHQSSPKPVVYKRGEVQLDTGNIAPVGYSMYLEDAQGGFSQAELFFEINDQQDNTVVVSHVGQLRHEWRHAAGVVDRREREVRLYIDGSQVAQQPIPEEFGSVSNDNPLHIGRTGFFPNQRTQWFRGRIDEVELFGRALGDSEIQSLFDARTCGKCEPEGEPDLATEKFLEGGLTPGQQGTYMIEVANLGSGPHSSPITVGDTLPSGFSVANVSAPSPWTCSWDSSSQEITCADTQLGAGDSFFITLTVNVPQDIEGEVENCATIQSEQDPNPDNDRSCTTNEVGPSGRADLATAKTTEGDFVAGQQGTYLVEISNVGSGPEPSPITVGEQLPSGFSVASVSAPSPWSCSWDASNSEINCTDTQLAAGDSFVITLTVDIPSDAEGDVENCATAQTSGTDPNPDNNPGCVTTTITQRDNPDMAVSKSHSGQSFNFGVNEWDITVENTGNTTIGSPITVGDSVPTGVNVLSVSPSSCSWDASNSEINCSNTLAPGDTLDITLTVEVTQEAGDQVENCVDGQLDNDSNPDNDADCDTVPVITGESCQGECTQPPSGMVSWWPMDDRPQTGSPVLDIADGNPGDPIGGVSDVNGKVNGANFFDGNDDSVEVPDSSSLNSAVSTNFAIDAWIHPTPAAVNSTSPIVNKLDTSGSAPLGYALRVENGDLVAEIGDGSSSFTVSSSQLSVPANQWTHVAVNFDAASGSTLYINGQQAGFGSTPNQLASNDVPLIFGANQDRSERFAGMIDEVELFDRLIQQSDFSAIHEAGPCGKCKGFVCRDDPQAIQPPSGMTAWWPLDEQSGSTSFDVINGNNGTWIDDPQPVTGQVDGAIGLDNTDDDSASAGESDHVEVPDDATLDFGNGSFTVDAWVNPLRQQNEFQPIVFKSVVEPVQGYQFELLQGGTQSQNLRLTVGDGNQNIESVSSSGTVPNDQWTHVAGVLDRQAGDLGQLKVYINGTLEGTQSLPQGFGSVSNDRRLFIGRDESGFGFFFGQIDEVELFDRALSDNEIADIANAGSSGKCKDSFRN